MQKNKRKASKLFTCLFTIIFLCHHATISSAFLFHQLIPINIGPSGPVTSNNGKVSPQLTPPEHSGNTNNYQAANIRYQVIPQLSISELDQQQQQQQQHQYQQPKVSDAFQGASPTPNQQQASGAAGPTSTCPRECNCNKAAQIADCSNRNLTRVPSSFPADTKRIRLERNNITELGPNSFKNLRRLQRIDLSNNNLQRIDPLAFAGGLQSLNSLILYSNKLTQLPVSLFSELSQLQLLLLNANALQCINKGLFGPLSNLNLLSLYDNHIETLPNGTFDGLKNIKTIHLGKNPLVCDCNLRWLADYLETNPVETSEARCEGPASNQAKKLNQLSKQKFKCEGNEQSYTGQLASRCNAGSGPEKQEQQPQPPQGSPIEPQAPPAPLKNQQQFSNGQPSTLNQQQPQPSSCPTGCTCQGSTIDCSRLSPNQASESRVNVPGAIYELPDMPDDVPVYVTRVRMNDSRIKRIRQTSLFRQLANSQKIDLGNNKIIDIEDNAIHGGQIQSSGPNAKTKPERIVFVLMEKETCGATTSGDSSAPVPDDACSLAPRVNPPDFDSPCYNGGSCILGARSPNHLVRTSNYSCLCPPGFAGPLCEINIDDCADHQCQNEATCIDGVNSYRCQCRDPSTSGEYCEQLTYVTSSANSIAPMALPMVAASSSAPPPASLNAGQASAASNSQLVLDSLQQLKQYDSLMAANYKPSGTNSASNSMPTSQNIQSRSADLINQSYINNNNYNTQNTQQTTTTTPNSEIQQKQHSHTSYNLINTNTNNNDITMNSCKRVTTRKYLEDENGCQSVKSLKISECLGGCDQSGSNCCQPSKIKKRKVRMQCNDNASYVKIIDVVKKCSCSVKCNQSININNTNNYDINTNQYNNNNNQSISSQLDQFGTSSHQIDTIDAVEI